MEILDINNEIKLLEYDLHKDFNLGKDDEYVEIYLLNDLHYGSRQCFTKQFACFKRFILEKPNRFIIILGDMMNQNIVGAVGSPFEDNRTPSEQRKQVAEELKDLKPRILCAIGGNHDSRVTKINDENPLGIICENLDIDFDPICAFVTIRYGKKMNNKNQENSYTFFCHHGMGGGRKTGSAVNNLEDMTMIGLADVYCIGHHHKKAGTRHRYFVPDIQNHSVYSKDMLYVISGSWQLYGGYGAIKALRPGAIGAGLVRLYNKYKRYDTVI